MFYFYIYAVISAMSLLFIKKAHFILIPIIVGVFLILLPSTGFDYDHYQEAFDNAYLTLKFPWFRTSSIITAEPLYLWYNSFIGVILPFGFPFFLLFNFLVCYSISFSFFDGKSNYLVYFWVALIPVVLPTVFYFSPRSSISFFLVLAGFFQFCKNQNIRGSIIIFLGCMIHSQYILISVFLIAIQLLQVYLSRFKASFRRNVMITFGIFSFLSILNVNAYIGVIESALGQLPSASVAVSKLHYLENARGGMRATSVLSIVVFPSMLFILLHKYKRKNVLLFSNKAFDHRFLYLISAVVMFGFLINIVFFNAPHLSGRLGRFSDYVGIAVVMPLSILMFGTKKMLLPVLFVFALLAPPLYPSLYNFTGQ